MPLTTAVYLQAFNLTAELTLNVGFPPYDNLCSIILLLEKVKPFETRFSTNQKAGIFVAPKVLQVHRATKVGVNNLKVFSRGRAGHTGYLTTLAGLNTIVAICNGGPSPVPRPKVLSEGRPMVYYYNYTLTLNNNYQTDHDCSRFSNYYKNQSSTT